MTFSLPVAALVTLTAFILPITSASAVGYDKHAAIGKQQIQCTAKGGAFELGPKADSFVCAEDDGTATICFYTDIDSHCADAIGRVGHHPGSGNAVDANGGNGDGTRGGFQGGILQPTV